MSKDGMDDIGKRNERILEDYRKGRNLRQLAAKYDLSDQAVRKILDAVIRNPKPPRPRKASDFTPETAKEFGRRGGKVSAAMRRIRSGPYPGTIIDLLDACGLVGDSWRAHRVLAKAIFGLPLSDDELELYRRHTARETPPTKQVAEAWLACGRRGGKSRLMAMFAIYLAVRFDPKRLAPGETAIVPVLAADKKQARAVFGYLKAALELDILKPYVHRVLRESIELRTGINIEVHTASFRTIRGYTCVSVVLDEVAFWFDEGANPDGEILDALRPSTLTVPDAMVLAGSSPYACRGELWRVHDAFYGKDDEHVLVWNADTRSMNPSVPVHFIERKYADDPVVAAAEYGSDGHVSFRRDVENFIDPAALRAVIVQGRLELPPRAGIRYYAFCDPSGGSGDSFTLAIAHLEKDCGVLDCIREIRPPFSPEATVQDYAHLLRSYGIAHVHGDRYGGEWPVETFRRHGILFVHADLTKNEIYREFLPALNAERVALLDVPVLRTQLLSLERRVSRAGKDSIDHPRGLHDDVANASCGALVGVLPQANSRRVIFGGR